MTDSAGLPPHAQAAVTHFAEGLARLRERTHAARAALSDAVGTAVSADGAVTVRVDPDGAVTDLRLTAGALDLAVDALAGTVLATARTARLHALEQAERDVAAVVGGHSRAVAVLHRQQQTLAGGSDPSRRSDGADDDTDDDTDEGAGFTGRC